MVGDVVGAAVGETGAEGPMVADGVPPVSAATPWSVPPATAAAATMIAPTAIRPIFLRDIRAVNSRRDGEGKECGPIGG